MGPAHRDALGPGLGTRVLDQWLVVYDRDAYSSCFSVCSSVSILSLDSGSLSRAPQGKLITTANGIVITRTESLRQPNGTADYHAYAIR